MLAAAADPAEYFRSLQAKLKYAVNSREDLRRLHDLCQKTTQFNLALQRFRENRTGRIHARPGLSGR
jgi:predicted enzyme involved in methoxymalonyl-ACP biosynthesis